MSISAQKQIIANINTFINIIDSTKTQLLWPEFVEKSLGDEDAVLNYLKLLNGVQFMDKPSELSIQFSLIRGQFANSEDKMIEQLIESNFEEGSDYIKIMSKRDTLEEEILYMSYRCLKAFVLDKNDKNMMLALMVGEEIYSLYKNYMHQFAKIPSVKHEWMIIEYMAPYKNEPSFRRYAEALNNPQSLLRILTGSSGIMDKYERQIKENPEEWGRIIIPRTKAIYENALHDVGNLKKRLMSDLFNDYKNKMKEQFKKSNPKGNAPDGFKWEFKIGATCIGIDPECKFLSHERTIRRIKSFWLETLSQAHTPLKKMNHEEYLLKITELEADRNSRAGFFSAVKADSIYKEYLTEMKRLETKMRRETIKINRKTARDTKSVKAAAEPISHSYETGGSEAEDDVEIEEEKPKEVIEEKKPTKKAPTKTNTKKAPTKKNSRRMEIVVDDGSDDENIDADIEELAESDDE